jgi:hypothetical protein
MLMLQSRLCVAWIVERANAPWCEARVNIARTACYHFATRLGSTGRDGTG